MKCVIFGGSGGLGKLLTRELEETGKYDVISLSSKDVDITDKEQVQEFFSKNAADIVINMSVFNHDAFAHKVDYDKVEKQIHVNILGTVNIVSCALPHMRNNNFGRIILMSSVLSDNPVVSTGIYAGSKGFSESYSKCVALENVQKGITCNCIQLGYFDGGLTYKIPDNFREHIVNNIPMKRLGTAAELSSTTNYLIENGYITGTSIKINGGIST
jgi:NAD(P)-dependent dehydrogenase (short-subunit alcohol dehydrogenase family)